MTHRTELLQMQERAYIPGTIACRDNTYFFYEEESDDILPLQSLEGREMEIYFHQEWYKGKATSSPELQLTFGPYYFQDGDKVRLKKSLPYAFDQMLSTLEDQWFFAFATHLNELGFSIYDCIYCYNQALFLEGAEERKGVSFFHFDNEEYTCAVQHHFERGETASLDRFEFTTSLSKRRVLISRNLA
ncbi:DUF2777 family protein [Bacillus lacus]|uniref:DUF2777 family protein n=1 Tax=Metabacillus lacus TaxID=1983721 RepID=A0A7X2J1D0_9BACI|nr:DUF2777 family protein [Metabacillus lacus]MRX73509.1 DUF2777 family protein [Metabacillus lacus]